jgi:hypothetical protein
MTPKCNSAGVPFRVCYACDLPHIENCKTCFGWGLFKGASGELVPLAAGDCDTFKGKSVVCSECGSDKMGLSADF